MMAASACSQPGPPVISVYMNHEKRYSFVEFRCDGGGEMRRSGGHEEGDGVILVYTNYVKCYAFVIS